MARSLKKEFWNAPNMITLVRIAVIPVFLYYTYFESRLHSFVAALIYAVTSATDFLDGYIARKKNLITVIGKFLDPLADKLIVVSALIMLVHLGRIAAWVVIVIMAREFIISGLRTIAMSEGIVIAAGQEGKYKTAIQLVGVMFLTVNYDYPIDFLVGTVDIDFNLLGTLLIYVSLVFSVWSAVKYFKAFVDAVYAKDAKAEADEAASVPQPKPSPAAGRTP